jgi:hypothetical protein
MESTLGCLYLIAILWVIHHVAHAEINQFSLVRVAEEYVLGLDIAVHDPQPVQMVKPTYNVSYAAPYYFFIKKPIASSLRSPRCWLKAAKFGLPLNEFSTLNEFHDE